MDELLARVVHENLDDDWSSLGKRETIQRHLEQSKYNEANRLKRERDHTFELWHDGEDRQQSKRPTPDIGIIFAGAIMGAAILAVSIFNLLPISEFYKESNSVNWLVAALGGIFGTVATLVNARARKSV